MTLWGPSAVNHVVRFLQSRSVWPSDLPMYVVISCFVPDVPYTNKHVGSNLSNGRSGDKQLLIMLFLME